MKIPLICLLIIWNIYGFSSEILEKRLRELNSVSNIKKIEPIGSFDSCYEILIKQPINHDKPDQGSFLQKVYLSHRNFHRPTVFFINGYISHQNSINEWSELLGTNQIYVEHRYFGQSKPENIDWETLNMKNACADLHRIRLLFHEIYTGKWISTGISKGGLTAVSYKYFYPNDVNATIALSTSIKTRACDTIFFSYIDSLSNSQGCLQELKDFQRQLLTNKNELLPLLEEHFSIYKKEHSRLGLNEIFETAVLEIPFAIWQNSNGCRTVQNFTTNTAEEMFSSLRMALNDWFMTDDKFINISAYHYQAMTELGYYCYPTSGLKDLLMKSTEVVSSVFAPENVEVSYSNDLMLAIKQWLTTSGDNIIYISGSNDPYSNFKIIPENNANSLSFVLENKNHSQVRFIDLDLQQKAEIMKKIEEWMN